ncbi:GNAT family N-acetyltransferase [Rubrolithibacter danxiaensis]|uniref:GNAT family N-acetyltransferase n=1 Tax=Rubrolithibacter danxiaensis TaxID=3390805 RepID=UPI003BF8DAA1
MTGIKFQIITPEDDENMELIAEWYLNEWKIPVQTTIEKIKNLSVDNSEFQVLLTVEGNPIATGGLYNNVGLLDREPRLKIYKNWLALVYTKPDFRKKGFGALICNYIQDHAKVLGLSEIYLFTHTAESLYKQLEWQQLERLVLGAKDIVVMKKELIEKIDSNRIDTG